LYLDVKAVFHETFVQYIRNNTAIPTCELATFSDETCEKLMKQLVSLAPEGVKHYHSQSLYDCIKTLALLLWPNELVLVGKPKLATLLQGIAKRFVAMDCLKTGVYADYDPIKQDFLFREQFRRTLVNDCMVIFEQSDNASVKEYAGVPKPVVDAHVNETGLNTLNAGSRPEHSTSRIVPRACRSVVNDANDDEEFDDDTFVDAETFAQTPCALQSNTDITDATELCKAVEQASALESKSNGETAKETKNSQESDSASALHNVLKPQKAQSVVHAPEDDTKSLVSKITKSVKSFSRFSVQDDSRSSASQSTNTTSVTNSVLRKPINVRTVKLPEQTL